MAIKTSVRRSKKKTTQKGRNPKSRYEKRDNPRLEVTGDHLIVKVLLDDQRIVDGTVLNLSLGGLCVGFSEPCELGAVVKIYFSSKDKVPFDAKMVWIQDLDLNSDVKQVVGFQFTNIENEKIDYLLDFTKNVLNSYPKEKLVDKSIELFASGLVAQADLIDSLRVAMATHFKLRNKMDSLSELTNTLILLVEDLEDPELKPLVNQLGMLEKMIAGLSNNSSEEEEALKIKATKVL